MVASMSDVVLVDDVESLFRAHYGRLVRALTLACGDREQAADAVQEAFVKAHLRWRRLQHYDDPVGWIRRVAINQLRDDHRRSGRKERALARLAGTTPTAVDDHAGAPNEAGITALLAGLPRQQRLTTALYYIDQLTVAEIATTLEISEGAVKFHLHAARERLRTTISGGPDQGGPR
jgi:RNA polymerase sigma-70 factor (ECF subfamily)